MKANSAPRTVLADLDQTRDWQQIFYQDLHQHPELSHQEHRTAAAVAKRLRDSGYDVTEGLGGTGVVGILRNNAGPSVLLRADMDALPVREATGLPYASTVTTRDGSGSEVPVMHACGHDVHVACLLGAAALLAAHKSQWSGTLVVLFQPAEELGDGARRMVDDSLADLVGTPDVALAQHVLPFASGTVGTRIGPVLSAADSIRVTVHGRGSHGSMPQASIDPVVLAAMIVIRLQTIVSREVAPTQPAVVTVGSIRAGSKSNVIDDHAVLELNVRTYDQTTRSTVLDAIKRIVTAECTASGSPREPEFELFDRFPVTVNDAAATERVRTAFRDHFGEDAHELDLQSASEDFSDIPNALGTPYSYWGIGGVNPQHRSSLPGHPRQPLAILRAHPATHPGHRHERHGRSRSRLARTNSRMTRTNDWDAQIADHPAFPHRLALVSTAQCPEYRKPASMASRVRSSSVTAPLSGRSGSAASRFLVRPNWLVAGHDCQGDESKPRRRVTSTYAGTLRLLQRDRKFELSPRPTSAGSPTERGREVRVLHRH